jgi:hypothetical protein
MHGPLEEIQNIGLMQIPFPRRGFRVLELILEGPTLNSFHLEVARGYVQAYHLL